MIYISIIFITIFLQLFKFQLEYIIHSYEIILKQDLLLHVGEWKAVTIGTRVSPYHSLCGLICFKQRRLLRVIINKFEDKRIFSAIPQAVSNLVIIRDELNVESLEPIYKIFILYIFGIIVSLNN